jgi:hypothetical protein
MEINIMYEFGRWENYLVAVAGVSTLGALYTAMKFDPKKEKIKSELENKLKDSERE